MRGPSHARNGRLLAGWLPVLLLVVVLPLSTILAVAPAASTEEGRDLFVGRTRFQNGGPPCASCHAISALGFPTGGAMGPDLSGIYQTLGPEGTDVTLQTLFFPTMMPLYEKRPLASAEQRALKAFLAQAPTTPVGQANELRLAALAVGGLIVLLAATWLAWRNRLRGVRAPLVEAHAGGRRT